MTTADRTAFSLVRIVARSMAALAVAGIALAANGCAVETGEQTGATDEAVTACGGPDWYTPAGSLVGSGAYGCTYYSATSSSICYPDINYTYWVRGNTTHGSVISGGVWQSKGGGCYWSSSNNDTISRFESELAAIGLSGSKVMKDVTTKWLSIDLTGVSSTTLTSLVYPIIDRYSCDPSVQASVWKQTLSYADCNYGTTHVSEPQLFILYDPGGCGGGGCTGGFI